MADVVERADAAADGDRHVDLVRGALDDVRQVVALVQAGDDVDEQQFVGAGS
jgi:hypothetical protein